MSIQLNKPYKIIAFKEKKYSAHYKIPSSETLVVPVRAYGEEVLCDLRWENSNGELKVLHETMFVTDNLVPLNPMTDDKLFDIYTHYYDQPSLKPEVEGEEKHSETNTNNHEIGNNA